MIMQQNLRLVFSNLKSHSTYGKFEHGEQRTKGIEERDFLPNTKIDQAQYEWKSTFGFARGSLQS